MHVSRGRSSCKQEYFVQKNSLREHVRHFFPPRSFFFDSNNFKQCELVVDFTKQGLL